MADSTAATVITKTATINPVKLLIDELKTKKFKEIEISITSIDIKSKMIFDLLIIIPNMLIVKRIYGNTVKEYIILTLDLPSFIHKLILKLILAKIKWGKLDLHNWLRNYLRIKETNKIFLNRKLKKE